MPFPTIFDRINQINDKRIAAVLDAVFQSFRPKILQVAAGDTYAMKATDARKLINLDTAAGSIVTLPQATGSQNLYRFRVSVIATTNSHVIKVAVAADTMSGYIFTMDDTADNVMGFFAVGGTSDTITLNRSTMGSVTVGEYIEVEDIAAGKFHVRGFTSSTGSAASPFSATV